jgi:pimeloyl-ACP methyl ester carboxylesterase
MADLTVQPAPAIRYDDAGAGSPVLLVHGLGGVGAYWAPIVDRLAGQVRLLVPDLPGFGRTARLPGESTSPRTLAVALAGWLDELDLPRVHVVGHSLGGYVAFELAALGRAHSVLGLAPAGLWAGEWQAGVSRGRLRLTHFGAAASHVVARPLVRLATRHAGGRLPAGISPDVALRLYDAYATAPGFGPVFRGTTGEPFARGAQIDVPITVVFGTRDTVIIAKDRRADRLPASTSWIELDGRTHNVPWEEPDLVADLVRAAAGVHR